MTDNDDSISEFNVIDWQSLDFTITERDKNNKFIKKKQFIVRAFGRTEDDNVICLEVRGFKPYFYFEIEELVDDEWINKTLELTNIEIGDILEELRNYIKGSEDCYIEEDDTQDDIDKKEALLKKDVFNEMLKNNLPEYKKKFDYFRNNKKDAFIKLIFKTKRSFNLYKKLLKKVSKNDDFNFDNKIYRFIQYESNIEPMIRFFHHQNIDPSGWIKFSGTEKTQRKVVQQHIKEYYCDYDDVFKHDSNIIAPFRIASFDIECTSPDGTFPQASRIEDKIIQIGITTHRQGEMTPYEQCMITLGPCDEIEGVNIILCNEESEILEKFADYIRDDLDPDIITGYNIWGFDWMYMYKRAELLDELGCPGLLESFCKMSRVTYETCRYVEKSLSSSALGDNLLKYITMTGRIQIDIFKLVQKDYNLSSYKLTHVSSSFLRGNAELLIDESISEEDRKINGKIHEIKSKSIDGIYVDNQISLIDQFENKISNDYKFTVTDIDREKKTIVIKENLYPHIERHIDIVSEEMTLQNVDFNPDDLEFKWCENKIDLPPQGIFDNFKKGTSESIREIAVYCIKDCVLCNSLLIKLDVVTKNIGMSNVCCVPLSYLFLRGQGVKVFSVIAKQCREDDFIMSVVTKEDFKGESSYEGAIVLEPKTGIYFKPVAVMDYSSLYPSSMISENISHDSLVRIQIIDSIEGTCTFEGPGSPDQNPLLMELDKENIPKNERYYYKHIEYNNYDKDKNIIGRTVCTYVQPPNNEKSVLPRVLQKLLNARKDTRKKQKLYSKDDFMWSILEGLQLAYKVTCNSLYGQVGASTSPVCKTELAASTTATGRELLEMARDMTLENYKGSECVYGDTDSVFIQFDTYDLSEAIRLGKEAGQKVTDKLIADGRQPHDLEYEKTFYPFILFSKKRYVGNKYEEDINKFSQNSMGIVLKRRDNARILKDIYQGIINTILNEKGDKDIIMQKAVDFYKNAVNRLMNGDVKFNKLEISKTVKGNYKNPTSIAHKVLADRMKDRDPGNAPATNDRVPYVYIDVNTLCCNNCNKTNIELSKCLKCLKLYGNCKLSNELKIHKEDDYTNDCFHNHECNIVCRFCHINLPKNHSPCETCKGFFCKKCNHTCINKVSSRLLQGDRIEHPDYLLKNSDIKPDYKYYFEHQIEKPVKQIFDLTDKKEEIEEFINSKFGRIKKEKKEEMNMFDMAKLCKKKKK